MRTTFPFLLLMLGACALEKEQAAPDWFAALSKDDAGHVVRLLELPTVAESTSRASGDDVAADSSERLEIAGEVLLTRSVQVGDELSWRFTLPRREVHLLLAVGLRHRGSGEPRAVEFGVILETPDATEVIHRQVLRAQAGAMAGWDHARIPLAGRPGAPVRLLLRANPISPEAASEDLEVLWGDPLLSIAPGGDRFNIVVVLVDTLRRDDLSCYGAEAHISPRIDQLAVEGALFTRAVTTSPWTLPSVASLLSGQYPSTHGAGRRTGRQRESGEPPKAGILEEVHLLPKLLEAEAGFQSALFHDNPYLEPNWGLATAFHAHQRIREGGDATVSTALRWMRGLLGQRMFVLLHLMEPHLPYDPPEPFRSTGLQWASNEMAASIEAPNLPPPEQNRRRRARGHYLGEVAYTDHLVGRFVDGLDNLGILDHTLLIFTSDHGEEFYEHSDIERANYNDPRAIWGVGHGHSQFQELLAAPLIIRFPSRVPAGTRVTSLTQIHDVVPSILEWVGIGQSFEMSGRSFLPALSGQDHRDFAFAEFMLYGDARSSYREDNWKLILGADFEKAELYDLSTDPGESTNLLGTHRQVARRLARRLLEVQSDATELASKLYSSTTQPEVKIDEQMLEELRALGYVG